jgi:hypothetical protein
MVNKRNRRLYYENKEAYLRRNRKSEIKRKYGITIEEHDRILIAQGDCCALCCTDTPRGQGTWHVDHDHDTGVVRGLLCHSCNTMLGSYERLKKGIGLERVAEYLGSVTASGRYKADAVDRLFVQEAQSRAQ